MKYNTSNTIIKLTSLTLLLAMFGCGRKNGKQQSAKGGSASIQTIPDPTPTPTPTPTTALEIQGTDIVEKETEFTLSIKNTGTPEVCLKDYQLKAKVHEVNGKTAEADFKGVIVKSGANQGTEITVTLGGPAISKKLAAGDIVSVMNKIEIDPKTATNVTVAFTLLDADGKAVATKQIKWATQDIDFDQPFALDSNISAIYIFPTTIGSELNITGYTVKVEGSTLSEVMNISETFPEPKKVIPGRQVGVIIDNEKKALKLDTDYTFTVTIHQNGKPDIKKVKTLKIKKKEPIAAVAR